MADFSEPRKVLTSDDVLPPVEPPSAGFIVQLFVVPAIIVVIIVMLWMAFHWLDQMGSEPRVYLQQIEQDNANSWFAANKLAEELRTNESLKDDRAVARQLATMLEAQITAAHMDDDKIRLRIFLCKALGEFHVSDGLPALLKAATTQRQPVEDDVRRSAIEAVALLIGNAPQSLARQQLTVEALPTLLAASRDDSPRVREPAAFALGAIGGQQPIARLVEMLGDTHANTRYNAATGLARHGNSACVKVLAEMLDVAELQLDAGEAEGLNQVEVGQARDFKRALIGINGMRAIAQLRKADPQADMTALRTAVQGLLDSKLEGQFTDVSYAMELRAHAGELKKQMTSN